MRVYVNCEVTLLCGRRRQRLTHQVKVTRSGSCRHSVGPADEVVGQCICCSDSRVAVVSVCELVVYLKHSVILRGKRMVRGASRVSNSIRPWRKLVLESAHISQCVPP